MFRIHSHSWDADTPTTHPITATPSHRSNPDRHRSSNITRTPLARAVQQDQTRMASKYKHSKVTIRMPARMVRVNRHKLLPCTPRCCMHYLRHGAMGILVILIVALVGLMYTQDAMPLLKNLNGVKDQLRHVAHPDTTAQRSQQVVTEIETRKTVASTNDRERHASSAASTVTSQSKSKPNSTSKSKSNGTPHTPRDPPKPIQTYDDFIRQYKRLYGQERSPPPRMKDWFSYAQGQECSIDAGLEGRIDLGHLWGRHVTAEEAAGAPGGGDLDVYRQIEADLLTFRKRIWHDPDTGAYHGDAKRAAAARQAIHAAAVRVATRAHMPGIHMAAIAKGKLTLAGAPHLLAHLHGLKELLPRLPDMHLFISAFYDEPRVLARAPTDPDLLQPFHHDAATSHVRHARKGQDLFALHDNICGNASARQAIPEAATPPPDASLAGHVDAPNATLGTTALPISGFVLGADTFDVTYAQVPFLAQAKIAGCYSDILYPSPYYTGDHQTLLPTLQAAFATPWHARSTTGGLFWRGSTTGTRATDTTRHLRGLRQRIVLWSLDQKRQDEKKPITVDAAFTAIIQHDAGLEGHLANVFNGTAPTIPHSDTFKHRYLLDADGNSFSRRFLPFLYSGSLTFRAGIFTDWLLAQTRPYWHYVPLDPALETLDARIRYYTGLGGEATEAAVAEADERGRRVAETARAFAHRRLRLDDVTCYVYRLLLEYAHLLYPEE